MKRYSPGVHDFVDYNNSDFEKIPEGVVARFRMILRNCRLLTSLPDGLSVGSLDLTGCTSLEKLPEDFCVDFLTLDGCAQLNTWPNNASLETGRLSMRGCIGFSSLPPWLGKLAQLDLRDCRGIRELPENLQVTSWIDVAGTGIKKLPPKLQRVTLRWRGVPVDPRIAFEPESISGDEVLQEVNAELRRVKLERMGFEKFLGEVNAETLDTDTAPGGQRRLLRVELPDDEPLVCVSVFCPSTDRQYIIRVPPDMKTCHQAVAWTAGFDDPALYQPLIET